MSRFLKVASALFDALLPRRPRRVRTESRTLEDIPLSPETHDLFGVTVQTIVDYRDSAVADLIQSLKYDGSGHAARLCATVLADYMREEIAAMRVFSAKQICLVAVPLHEERLRERGFNQVETVLRNLPPEFHNGELSRVKTNVLSRTRATKQQTRLSRAERLLNVQDAFKVSENALPPEAIVFLIDDVVTTGATLASAAKPLKELGVEAALLALARA